MTEPSDSDRDTPDDSVPRRSSTPFGRQLRDKRAGLERQAQATKAQWDATNERIQQRTGRNLVFAVLIGLVAGALLLVSLLILKELFMVFAGAVAAFTAFEFATALRGAGLRVPRVVVTVVAVAMVPAAYYLHASGQWLAAIAGILALWIWRVVDGLPRSRRVPLSVLVRDLVASALTILYIPYLACFAVVLDAQPDGQWWVLSALILVVVVDTGAYVAGLTWGRHPMAPVISPKKTWEGFAGAAAAALVAGVLLAIFMLHMPFWFGLVFGALLLGTATMGDLTESLLKRDIGIKDMSSWLPGHGGFFDRLDSILPSVAMAYVLYAVFDPLFH